MKITGVTLVELLITTVLALLLILVGNYFYSSVKNNFNIQNEYARLQENGRFSAYYLNNYLSMAGYTGCFNLNTGSLNNLINNPSEAYMTTAPIQGNDGLNSGFSPGLSTAITGNPMIGSDVISIHTTATKLMFLTNDMGSSTNDIPVNNTLNITAGQVVLITNCQTADLFVATAGTNDSSITHESGSNQTNQLGTSYLKNNQVLPFHFYAFYVTDTGRVNTANQPIYALVQEDENHTITELVEGIENIKILYAVDDDTAAGPNLYQTATQVTNSNNWNHVVGIQMSLLVSSIQSVAKVPQAYYFNMQTTVPTDGRLRKQWEIFIPLSPPTVILQ